MKRTRPSIDDDDVARLQFIRGCLADHLNDLHRRGDKTWDVRIDQANTLLLRLIRHHDHRRDRRD